MTWTKRDPGDPVSNLVVLGDDEGQVEKVGGLLASVKQDTMYPSRMNYELVRKEGASIWLAGSASIGRQLGTADVGKFVKCRFTGWGKSKNGRFKEIEVMIWNGEANDDMKAWPRFKELSVKRVDEPPPGQPPEDEGDDDLPF